MQLSGGRGMGDARARHSAVPRKLGISLQIYENSRKHRNSTINEERAADDMSTLTLTLMNLHTRKHKMLHIFESFHLNEAEHREIQVKQRLWFTVLQQQYNQQNAAAIAFCNMF